MIDITHCPICNGESFTPFLNCIDYTVSRETFHIIRCNTCNFLITSPAPDQHQIANYYSSQNYISHSNTSKTLRDRIYKIARKFTLSWKLNLIQKHLPHGLPKSILDYGCGTGHFLNNCKSDNWTIQGLEPAQNARTVASNLTQTPIAANFLELGSSKYSIITLWHVLEHIHNLNETINQLKQRLVTQGLLLIAVPNYRCADATHYQQDWAAYDVPRHLWHFEPSTILRLLKNHHLQLIHTEPMKLDAFYVSLLSEQNRKNSHPYIHALRNGLTSNYQARKTNHYSSLIYIAVK